MKKKLTYKQAEAYLLEIPKFTTKNPIGETRGFYHFLKREKLQLGKVIHVAGTNGKGSVCAFMNSVLVESGYHVGMFTSPHLITMRERFQIDGKMVSEEKFLEAFCWLEDKVEDYRREVKETYSPTFFERLFFMGIYIFAAFGVDITILETGMGGRLDATNVIEKPAVCVITEIGLDHMRYLGNTLAEIAAEKAGIIKEQVPVVFVDRKKEISDVLETMVEQKNTCCYKVSKNEYKINEIQKKCIDFSVCSRYYDYIRLSVGVPAVYQVENAAAAVRALELLKESDACMDKITRESIEAGISKTKWPGRMEEVLPGVYIDGAHNEDGVKAFMETVEAVWALTQDKETSFRMKDERDGKCFLIFSAVNDKKYDRMIELLSGLSCITEIIITRIPNERAVNLNELENIFRHYTGKEIHVFEEIQAAMHYCIDKQGERDKVYIVGSLYLAGLAKDLVRRNYHD